MPKLEKRTITGDKELDKILLKIQKNTANKWVRQGLRHAAKTIALPQAKRRVPHDTGSLEKSLTVRAGKRSRKGPSYMVATRPTKDEDAYYGVFTELGTKHITADPYLRPAIYDYQNEIRDAVGDFIWKEIKTLRVPPKFKAPA